MLGRALVLALAIVAHGCGARAFVCTGSVECNDGGIAGVCEPSGGCSFPDDDCDSGRRYGAHAPDGLGGTCVPLTADETSTSYDPTIASTPTATTSLETTVADTSTGNDPSTTGAVDPTSSTTAIDSSGAESSGPDLPQDTAFFDDFERRDADALGNGWIEATAGSFQLVNGRVVLGDSNGLSFPENVCRRPSDEALLDVEASVIVEFTSPTYAGFPQLHLRAQDTSDVVTAYVIFVDTTDPEIPPTLDIARIIDGAFTEQIETELPPFPGNAQRYRMRARVVGTDPVVVDGWFEVEQDGSWNALGSTTLVDIGPMRIVDPGVVAFSAHVQLQHLAYDDFAYDVAVP
jgi:hypothetical protein